MTTTAAGERGHARSGAALLWRIRVRRLVRRLAARDSDLLQIALAAAVGVAIGLSVSGLRFGIDGLHQLLFGLEPGRHLSDGQPMSPVSVLLVPVAGGLIVGVFSWAWRRWRKREIVDAIEANALYGGRLSLRDSLALVGMTVGSTGFGASVGMEAAYTQLGSGAASKIGQLALLRRADLRILVGAGAAAAIAAAYNAPLAGAFYAFELIVGGYTLPALVPVTVGAVMGALTTRIVSGAEPVFTVPMRAAPSDVDYALFVLLGLVAACIAILTMRSVTLVERGFRRDWLPVPLRPAIGGLALGALALAYPQTLGSGHGAILNELTMGFPLEFLTALLFAKIAASAIAVGSGFRGGLFSCSLFLGCILGSLFAAGVGQVSGALQPNQEIYALVGMGAVAATIVGAPVTMILLVLETTDDFPVAVGVMIGVLVATVAVRHWFGYSFATWRFHLRGVRIRGAFDVGWISDLHVGAMMRRDFTAARADAAIGELRAGYPLGSTKRLVLIDAKGAYLGLVDADLLHASSDAGMADAVPVRSLVPAAPAMLLPEDDIRTALERFAATSSEILVVVDGPETRRPIGLVSEAYALRRYALELERQRAEETGGSALFSPTVATLKADPR